MAVSIFIVYARFDFSSMLSCSAEASVSVVFCMLRNGIPVNSGNDSTARGTARQGHTHKRQAL